MKAIDITPQTFKVSDFLGWQREKTLVLSPSFQRRKVWKKGAKSYLIDTIVRGLPVPAIMVRERLDLSKQRTIREVVDGQQRLRTLFSFIDPKAVADFDIDTDTVTVQRNHNAELAGKSFKEIGEDHQARILGYKFSTHVLPPSVEDRDVLLMFARINSTGVKVTPQELRNAQFFGVFKDLMYQLALEQLERWRDWKIFSEYQIARMSEVELISDLALSALKGLSGKNQKAIDGLYLEFDTTFAGKLFLERRFRRVMDTIESTLGSGISDTVFSGQVHFLTLFLYLYSVMYGLGSSLDRKEPAALPKQLDKKLRALSSAFEQGKVPADVIDAVVRAPVDQGRRKTRLEFYAKSIG